MAVNLTGRIAYITGAGSGIGKAICELFAKQGASVIATDIANIDKVRESLHVTETNKHMDLTVDVTQSSEVINSFNAVCNEYGRPPCITVNCAGVRTTHTSIPEMSESDFDKVINVNLKGTFLVTKCVSNLLIKHKVTNASIVNVSSIIGKIGAPLLGNYAASKGGVISLTKTTAMELARFGVRCNAVLPGLIRTPMTDGAASEAWVENFLKNNVPMRRYGEPEEVAEACLFLASDQSRYVNGAMLEVTGGFAA